MTNILQIQNLSRRFGKTIGIDMLSLSVREGEIFGFLGPNGAGKTTTIRIVMNLIRADSGTVDVFGRRVKWGDYGYRKEIGFLPGELPLAGGFYGESLLDYWQDLSGGKAPLREKCLQALDFNGKDLKRKTGEYSTGMKQKLGITGALQHNPRLIILDEPTNGLDPLVKHAFLELLREVKAGGATVFFSSHNLSEVEQIADRTAIIRRGKVLTEAPIAELKRRHHKHITITFKDGENLRVFREKFQCEGETEGSTLKFLAGGELTSLMNALCGREIMDLNIADPALEDIFLRYYEGGDE